MSKVIMVLPHDHFRDEEYTEIRTQLEAAGHRVLVASNHASPSHGHFGLLVNPDLLVHRINPSDFDALLFVGGRGVEEYLNDSSVTRLIQESSYQGKIIGALGMAVELLAQSGIMAGKKITCDSSSIEAVKAGGGYYNGRLVEEDQNIITGMGVKSTHEFANTISRRLK